MAPYHTHYSCSIEKSSKHLYRAVGKKLTVCSRAGSWSWHIWITLTRYITYAGTNSYHCVYSHLCSQSGWRTFSKNQSLIRPSSAEPGKAIERSSVGCVGYNMSIIANIGWYQKLRATCMLCSLRLAMWYGYNLLVGTVKVLAFHSSCPVLFGMCLWMSKTMVALSSFNRGREGREERERGRSGGTGQQ